MALNAPVAPPNTLTQTSHAVTIHSNRSGILIGAINQWNAEQSMATTPVYEFGSVTGPYGTIFGEPYERVPGNISGQTISIQRYDVYTSQMESAFGTARLDNLSSDPGMPNGGTGHLDIRDSWRSPDGSNNYSIIYCGAWFTRIGRTLTTSGDRLVNVNATLEYTHRMRQNT